MSGAHLFLAIGLTLAGIPVLYGQDTAKDIAAVRAQFEDPGAVAWVEEFRGTWQGLHPVRMILGYDGETYLGKSVIGDLTFELFGGLLHDHIVLQEIDENGATSGYYVLMIRDGRMTGQWQSLDFERSAILSLRNNSVVELRSFQPEVLVLDGNISGAQASFIIQREEPDLLSGFYTAGSPGALYRLSGKCESPACDNMLLHGVTPEGDEITLRCTRQSGNTYQLTQSAGPRDQLYPVTGQAVLRYRFQAQIERHYAYIGSVDDISPRFNIPALDTWIMHQFEVWRNETVSMMDSTERMLGVPGPQERWSLRSSAWLDLTLFTPDVVSGILTMYDSGAQMYQRQAFIYDVRDERPVAAEEMSRKQDFTETLRQDAREMVPNEPASGLQHITLGRVGFVVFSDFDHQRGDNWVLLPYERYADAYKRNALVRKFLKSP